MSEGRNFQLDVIACWKRSSDGVEVRLRRDGRVFFFFPRTGNQHVGLEGQLTSIDVIEQWCQKETDWNGFART